jgi:hypothetical protein
MNVPLKPLSTASLLSATQIFSSLRVIPHLVLHVSATDRGASASTSNVAAAISSILLQPAIPARTTEINVATKVRLGEWYSSLRLVLVTTVDEPILS